PFERLALVAEQLELLVRGLAQSVAEAFLDLCPRDRRHVLVASHADVAVEPPRRQDDPLAAKGAVPRLGVLIVRVDERAVEIEESGSTQRADSVFSRWPLCTPSRISSTILRLNAGMSSGLRLVTRPWSTTTSSFTQVPPALRMSVWSVGHDVSLRPRTT